MTASWILTIIDVFSKQAWAFKLKNKKAVTVLDALKSLMDNRKPKRVHCDEGNEFLNSDCKKYMEKNGINLYVTRSDLKASIHCNFIVYVFFVFFLPRI